MQIARTEPVGDAAALFVENCLLLTDGPVAAQRPLIEPWGLCRVNVALIFDNAAGRNEILATRIAYIGLGDCVSVMLGAASAPEAFTVTTPGE